ncbi:Cyclin-dependent kinase 2 like protein [Plasmodiophora brassicae]
MDPVTIHDLTTKFLETSQQYQVDYLIGQGAFGKVYKAHRKDNPSKFVAIKHMNSVREGMGIPQDAYREIKILKEISRFPHENIVTLERVFMNPHGAGHSPGLSLVYDYAEHDLGEIIRHHRKTNTRMEPRMIKSIIWQLLKGVQFLHENWIMHRDLKPQNILVTDSGDSPGTVKIADFGLARIFQDPLRSLVADGDVCTIWYRAPELLLGACHYTRAVDIWSIGCVFAELILTRAIFTGSEVKKKHAVQADQIKKIFRILGKPDLEKWPDMKHLMFYGEVAGWPADEYQFCLPQVLKIDRNSSACDLLLHILEYDPKQRWTAEQALQHRYFTEPPEPHQNVFVRQNGQVSKYPARMPAQEAPGPAGAPPAAGAPVAQQHANAKRPADPAAAAASSTSQKRPKFYA